VVVPLGVGDGVGGTVLVTGVGDEASVVVAGVVVTTTHAMIPIVT